GEVEVFDDDRPGAVFPGGGDQGGDGGTDPAVAGRGGQPGQLQRDGGRDPGDVAVRGEHGDGEVAGVHVHRDDGRRAELAQRRDRPRGDLPRRVQVPPVLDRVVGDVVPHRAGGGLRGHLVAP